MSLTQEQIEQRRLGIGGSDIASVFNVGWGCRRRLIYSKRNTPQDYPFNGNRLTRLGNTLEPLFAEMYAEETGRRVEVREEPEVNSSIPELRVRIDRKTWRNSEPGPIEIKAQGRGVFYASKREGLAEDYVLQLQAGMLATDTRWGAFVIGNRDNGDLISFDVDRSEALCTEIRIEVPRLWSLVENGPLPDALEPDDKRCQRCEWRKTCHGNALIQVADSEITAAPELLPLVRERQERKAMFDEAEELLEETTEQLKTELGERQGVMVGDVKVLYRPQEGRTLYKGKELLEAYRKAAYHLRYKAIDAQEFEELGLPKPESFIEKSKPSRPLRFYGAK